MNTYEHDVLPECMIVLNLAAESYLATFMPCHIFSTLLAEGSQSVNTQGPS